jgi:hypothetical protein
LRLLTAGECQKLVAHGINPLHAMRTQVTGVAPLKTLARGSGAGPEASSLTYRRRQLLTINSVEQGTRWACFEARDRNTWPRLGRQVRSFLLGLSAGGAFGKGADMQHCEVVCDERLNNEDDLAAGRVHCLVSIPTPRAGEFRSYMLTHSLEGSRVRNVQSRQLPAGTRFAVGGPAPSVRDWTDDNSRRRTLAQELFAPTADQRPAMSSDVLHPEAAAARRIDLNLIARLHGEPEHRGQRF